MFSNLPKVVVVGVKSHVLPGNIKQERKSSKWNVYFSQKIGKVRTDRSMYPNSPAVMVASIIAKPNVISLCKMFSKARKLKECRNLERKSFQDLDFKFRSPLQQDGRLELHGQGLPAPWWSRS